MSCYANAPEDRNGYILTLEAITMDIIEMARELGKEIQKDARYLRLVAAREANDADQNLQELIEKFNLSNNLREKSFALKEHPVINISKDVASLFEYYGKLL